MKLIPYVEINGSWTLTDDYMKRLWDLMVEENTMKKVFYTGTVKDADGFVRWLKVPTNNTVIVTQNDGEPLALCWLNAIEDHRGCYSFNVFKRAWGTRSVEVIEKIRDYWLYMKDADGNYVFNVLVGLTPSTNRLALRMVQKCGGTVIGEIPDFFTNYWTGKRVGCCFSYVRRD